MGGRQVVGRRLELRSGSKATSEGGIKVLTDLLLCGMWLFKIYRTSVIMANPISDYSQLKQAPPEPHQGYCDIYKEKKCCHISSLGSRSARSLPSHSTVKLIELSWSGIRTPVGTRAVDCIAVQNTSCAHHLRLSLQELDGKTLRCVPRNVTMQEPGLRRQDTLAHVRPGI